MLAALLHAAPAQAKALDVPLRCPDSAPGAAAVDVARAFRPGITPRIFLALGSDRYPALAKLLAAGENPNICHAGMSPLMLAVAMGDAKAVTMLLGAGALPDRPRDANGATVLHYALSAPQFAIATVLLERGADARLLADGNKTTLHSLALQPSPPPAVRAQQTALAGRLLRQQVAIDAIHAQGSTALAMAISAGNVDLVTYLLAHKANPALPNKRGEDALTQARRLGHAAMVERLQQHSAIK